MNTTNNSAWVGVEADTLEWQAGNPDLPAHVKLWLLALTRTNKSGHAEFVQSELADLLGINSTTGEQKTLTASRVWSVLKKAKELRLIHQDSNVRCIRPVGHRRGTSAGGSNQECRACR